MDIYAASIYSTLRICNNLDSKESCLKSDSTWFAFYNVTIKVYCNKWL